MPGLDFAEARLGKRTWEKHCRPKEGGRRNVIAEGLREDSRVEDTEAEAAGAFRHENTAQAQFAQGVPVFLIAIALGIAAHRIQRNLIGKEPPHRSIEKRLVFR